MIPIRTILHPTDFSESAEAAFSIATLLARQHSARILVLHVRPRSDNGSEAEAWHRLGQHAAPGPETTVETRLANGEAVPEIVRVAEEEGCDLIVMGTHGQTGLAGPLAGSVAEGVMRRATSCPVVTVRIPAASKAPRKAEGGKLAAV